VGKYFLGSLINQMHKFRHIEAIIGELGMCPALGMVSLVLRIDQLPLLPSAIANATQASQILVAIGILAVIQLEYASPVGQEEQVRQSSAVHADEYVRVPGDGQLVDEGEPTGVIY